MIRITCQYDYQTDGSCVLKANETWRFKKQATIHLGGNELELWNTLRSFAEAPPDEQERLLEDISPATRNRLVTGASLFQMGGFIELRKGLNSSYQEAPNVPRLHKIHMEFTHRCNFACTACYLGPKLKAANSASQQEGTTEQWLKLIEEAAALGCSFATLTGGEPLLRKDAQEILTALTANNIICEINTNASCITERLAERLKKISIATVAVSLYGYNSSSTHTYTHNKNSFQSALRGIENLINHNIPTTVKYFATRDSLDGFQQAQKKLTPLGIKAKLIGHTIHGDIFEGEKPDVSVLASIPVPPLTQSDELPCHPGIGGLAIEPDGQIRACPKLSVYFGNAFEDGLANVWRKSYELDIFRSFWPSFCKKEGYVPGVVLDSLCPASKLLDRPQGLTQFKADWEDWQQGADDVQA